MVEIPGTWIVENALFACRYPANCAAMEELSALGVSVVINLDEEAHQIDMLETYRFQEIHLPLPDFSAPSRALIECAVSAIDDALEQGQTVAVHCRGGLGRTGTILAGWLVRHGEKPSAAIARIREIRPHSIETAAQEAAVHAYADSIERA